MRLVFKLASAILILVLVLLITATQAQTPARASRGIDSRVASAAVQHEIVAALLQKKDFNRVLPELKKILDLRLPVEYETAVVEEFVSVSNQLMRAQRFDMAHQAVDAALQRVSADSSKLFLYIQSGRIHREQGNLDAAMEAYEKAKRFRKKEE